jgi:hypothetical protein
VLEGRTSFLKKKKQKTFAPGSRARRTGVAPMIESFLVLFFKKELLPSLPYKRPNPRPVFAAMQH